MIKAADLILKRRRKNDVNGYRDGDAFSFLQIYVHIATDLILRGRRNNDVSDYRDVVISHQSPVHLAADLIWQLAGTMKRDAEGESFSLWTRLTDPCVNGESSTAFTFSTKI